jgi:RNA polymerase sigma factor (sigma-70 family)
MGLVYASQKYNPKCGASFTTYAYQWIRGQLLTHYLGVGPPIPSRGVRLEKWLKGRRVAPGCLNNSLAYSSNGLERQTICKDLVGKLMCVLTEDERQAVIDRFYNDMQIKEMEEQGTFERKTYSRRLSKALEKMRQAYGELE